MLEIIAVIFIGKYFFKLAETYEKSKWGYAILGIVTFYATVFITGFIYAMFYISSNPYATEDDISTIVITLLSIPIGLGVTYLLYYLLEKSWKKNFTNEKPSIDDIGKN